MYTLIDIIALVLYIIALISTKGIINKINKKQYKELEKLKRKQYEISKSMILIPNEEKSGEYASITSRIYQSKILIYTTLVIFVLLLSSLIYDVILNTAEFKPLPFFIIIVIFLVINTYKLNNR